uniref:Uncharacterized protein n=1 Tax=Siphoviridae sp. ctUcA20 TaxID=2825528 RepID=A0A8S5PNT1_9CAUD|nr:MAG TPA: hypothetical protein [Siphoviridae sp. ctUcA20]
MLKRLEKAILGMRSGEEMLSREGSEAIMI